MVGDHQQVKAEALPVLPSERALARRKRNERSHQLQS
jgi:hypothetical protein